MKRGLTIHRTRIGKEIIAEFTVPRVTSNRVAILAVGMPSMPSKSGFMDFLTRKGYWVINPRYRGTWESAGTFLHNEPTEDLKLVIKALNKPLVSLWEGTSYRLPKKKHIVVFGNSFGGPAGILVSMNRYVKAVIAVAPVVNWRAPSKAEPLQHMFHFIRKTYGEGIRIRKSEWKKLGKGDFYNPVDQLEAIDPKKILIFHAKDDQSVQFTDVDKFALQSDVEIVALRRGGHLGFSFIQDQKIWLKTKSFLRKRGVYTKP